MAASLLSFALTAAPTGEQPSLPAQSSGSHALGVFSGGTWFLDRTQDGLFDPAIEASGWGSPGDTPIVGDFTGDGLDEIAVFTGGHWFIDFNADGLFDPAAESKGWGVNGWTPIVGDWDGDGVESVGAVSPGSVWFLDVNGDFAFDEGSEMFGWGSPGDTPIAADFNGDGKDELAVFSGGIWFIDFNGDKQFNPATEIKGWGVAGWTPVVGDWNGDGKADIGVISPAMTWFPDLNGDFAFDPSTEVIGWGSAGDTPLAADFDGDGRDEIGVYSDGNWFIDFNHDRNFDSSTEVRGWGSPGDRPVSGRWRLPRPAAGMITVDPPSGSVDLPTNRRIILTMPSPVAPGSVNAQTVRVSRSGAPVSVERRVSYDGRFVSLAGALSERGAEVEIVVEGLQTTAGEAIQPWSAKLTAGDAERYHRVEIVNEYLDAAPINATLLARFSHRIDPTSFRPDEWVLHRAVDGREFPVDCELNADWRGVRCLPRRPLDVGARFALTSSGGVSSLDSVPSGFSLPIRAGFSTDQTPPRLLVANPPDGGVGRGLPFRLFFDEVVMLGPGTHIQVLQNGSPAEFETYIYNAGREVIIAPRNLSNGSVYTLTASGVANLAGLAMEGSVQMSYTHQDQEPEPTYSTRHFPGSYSSDVPVNARALVWSPQALVPATVTSETVWLQGPSGRTPATVSLDSDDSRVVVTPVERLTPWTQYSAHVNGVVSQAGGLLDWSWTFETGERVATTLRRVVAMSPANGATGLPLQATVAVLSSEKVASQSVIPSHAKLMTVDGVAVDSQLHVKDRAIRLTPYSPGLEPDTAYVWEIRGVVDEAGRDLPAAGGSFRTGPPEQVFEITRVTAMSPPAGSEGVALDVTIDITVDRPLDPTTVTPEHVKLELVEQGLAFPARVTAFNGGFGVRIEPLEQLRPLSLYRVLLSATDLANRQLFDDDGLEFTTGPGPQDTTPPRVVSISIDEGATVKLDNQPLRFSVLFSEPIAPLSMVDDAFLFSANGQRIVDSLVGASDHNRRLDFAVGASQLLANAEAGSHPSVNFEIWLTRELADLAGNRLAEEVNRRFRVDLRPSSSHGIGLHEARPTGRNVAPTAPITLIFTAPFRVPDLAQALHVSQEGVLVAGVTESLAGNQVLRFTPSAPWTPGALIQVFVRDGLIHATEGSPFYDRRPTHSFHVAGGLNEPFAVEAFSSNIQGILPYNVRWLARLNRPVDPASVSPESVQLVSGRFPFGQTPVPILTRVLGGDVVEAIPQEPLVVGQRYVLTLTSLVRDQQGNPLEAQSSWEREIGADSDSTSLALEAVSPPQGFQGVPLNAPLRARYSEAGETTLLDESNAALTCDGVPIPIDRLTFTPPFGSSAVGAVISLIPSRLLPPGATCSASLAGVQDRAGNQGPVANWSFQTGVTVDTASAGDPVRSPQGESVGVNAVPMVRFPEPFDPTSFDPDQASLSSHGVQHPGSVSLSPDFRTLTFVPDAPLAVGVRYQMRFADRQLGDLAGNALGWAGLDFKTGFGPDADPPKILDFNVEDGQRNVTTFPEFEFRTDEIFDPVSLNTSTVQLLDGSNPLPLRIEWDDYQPTNVRFHATVALELGRTYTVRIAGLRDTLGNAITTPFLRTFTTRSVVDFTAPTATSNMRNYPRGLYRNVRAKVRFDEPVDPASIRPDTVYYIVRGIQDMTWPTEPTLDASGTVVELRPLQALPANSTIEVVARQVLDLAGNAYESSSYAGVATFVTGDALTDTEAPTLVWPAGLANAFPRDPNWSVIESFSSEPLDPWSYGGNLLELRDADGNLLPSTVRYLEASATYTLSVKPAADFAGNPLTPPPPLTVTTAAAIDFGHPSLVGHTPERGAVNVPVDVVISVEISEPVVLDYASLSRDGNVVVDFTHSYSADGKTIFFDPVDELEPDTQYRLVIDVKDWNGNGFRCCPSEFSFTTASGVSEPDLESPMVLTVDPPDGASNVERLEATLVFSEPLRAETLAGGVAIYVDGELSRQDLRFLSDSTVRISGSSWPDQAEVTVVVTPDATDHAGNAAVPFVSRFGFARPNASHTGDIGIQDRRPAMGATDVARDAAIYAFLTGPIDPTTLPGAVYVSLDGSLITGDVTALYEGRVIRFQPDNPYPPGSRIRLFVDMSKVSTPEGLPAGHQTLESTFLVSGPLPSDAVQYKTSTPWGNPRNMQLLVDFDRPMDPSTINSQTVLLAPGHPFNMALENGNTRLRIWRDSLWPVRNIRFELSTDIKAADGTRLAGMAYPANVGVQDYVLETPHEILLISPPDETTGVGANGAIDLVFSNSVNTLTVNEQTVRWTDGTNQGVPCTIAIETGNKIVRITPHEPFAPLETYTLTIEGVEDITGAIAPTKTVVFTAGELPDFVRPTLLRASPSGSDAPLNAVAVLRFDEVLGSGTVNEHSVQLLHVPPSSYPETPVPAVVSLSGDGKAILVDSVDPLEPNQRYKITRNGSIADLSGNRPFTGDHWFTTGVTTDTTPPELQAVFPAAGAVDVPINHKIVLILDSTVRAGAMAEQAQLKTNGVPVPFKSYVNDRFVELRPLRLLDPGTAYDWSFDGLEDLAGNAMADPLTGSFTTGSSADLQPVRMLSSDPVSGATGVALDAAVTITFDRPINPARVQPWNGRSALVSADLLTVTFASGSPLLANWNTELHLTSLGFEDLTGNRITGVSSVSFRTRGP